PQKGFDLIEEAIPNLMTLDLQVVILGTGEPATEERFKALQQRYRERIGLRIGFDEGLAHRMEAGADMFLMPSQYEPCGLSQLYSLRYGTIPIVRNTGGLADTVVPFSSGKPNPDRATGFHITQHTANTLISAIEEALPVFQGIDSWNRLIENAMNVDVSWARSAKAYVRLFGSLTAKRIS
ncbi:MAG TPA: glycosyltransferase, partial [Nitrospiraceae bacterium]